MSAILRFDDVHRHFGDQQVLRGLSFAVQPGQVYAFLGRNGAGKTTALRILTGFLAPHRGTASILGVDSQHLLPGHRARIGYVGEGHALDPTLRVRDAVAFERGTRSDFRADFADEALRRCGLRPAQYVARLSRGQRAQLSLVLAVATRPEVLVFDDPAMGLDVVMRREFLDAMIDLLSDSGCTVLFSSHVLTDVERVADRVGLLHDGALLVDATMDDLKQRVRRAALLRAKEPVRADDRHVLRSRQKADGFELLLLDAGPDELARLARLGQLVDLRAPSLEELFLDLTGPDRPGLLSAPARDLAQTAEVAS